MEDTEIMELKVKICSLISENEKLKKTVNMLAAFVTMMLIIQIYNLISRFSQ